MLQEVIRCVVHIGGRHQVAVKPSVASEAFGGSEAIVPNKIVLFVSSALAIGASTRGAIFINPNYNVASRSGQYGSIHVSKANKKYSDLQAQEAA